MHIKKQIQLTTKSLEVLINQNESIDFRLDEASWENIHQGDIIEFWEDFSGWDKKPSESSRRVQVQVIEIFRSKTFSELIDKLPKSFTKFESKEEIIQNLRQWWTPEKEKQQGVLGWYVKVIQKQDLK